MHAGCHMGEHATQTCSQLAFIALDSPLLSRPSAQAAREQSAACTSPIFAAVQVGPLVPLPHSITQPSYHSMAEPSLN